MFDSSVWFEPNNINQVYMCVFICVCAREYENIAMELSSSFHLEIKKTMSLSKYTDSISTSNPS